MKNNNNILIDWRLFTLLLMLLNCSVIRSQDFETIDSDLLKIIKKHKVPGITYSIISPKVVYSSGVGKINVNGKEEIKDDTRVRVGSITKSFIAIGLLQLQEKGILSLDNKLKELIPEVKFKNKWSNSPLTIRHLLEHTSGLDEIKFNEIYGDDQELGALEVIYKTPSALKVKREPGSYFQYSNSGYLIAGYILEKFSGQRFESYLKENILDPLNMKNSTFESFYLQGPQPIHHIFNKNRIQISQYRQIMNRWAGTFSTTAQDMSKLVRFLANREEGFNVLKKSSILELETPLTSIASKNGIKTGYALGIMRNTFQNQIVVGNRGGGFDLHARYYYSPSSKMGFFFSMNISNRQCAIEINEYLTSIVFSDSSEKNLPKTVSIDQEKINNIIGFYQANSSRMSILTGIDKLISGVNVYEKNDSLFLQVKGQSTRSIFTNDDERFFTLGSSIPHIYIGNQNGSQFLIETNDGGGFYYKRNYLVFLVRQICVFVGLIISFLTGIFFLLKIVVGIFKKDFQLIKKFWTNVLLPIILIVLALLPTSIGLHEIEKLGSFNLITITIFLLSIAYPILSVLGTIKSFNKYKLLPWSVLKVMAYSSCIASIIVTLFLIFYGYSPLILW